MSGWNHLLIPLLCRRGGDMMQSTAAQRVVKLPLPRAPLQRCNIWLRAARSTANELGIGPMGFGGKTTLLGVKIGTANRVPASYFVSISYMCWAFRRHGASLAQDGTISEWLY